MSSRNWTLIGSLKKNFEIKLENHKKMFSPRDAMESVCNNILSNKNIMCMCVVIYIDI